MTKRVRRGLVGVTALGLAGVAAWWAFAGKPKPDPERLQGTWIAVAASTNGEPVDPAKVGAMGLTVAGDEWRTKSGVFEKRYRLALAADKTPPEIDLTQLGPDGNPEAVAFGPGKREPVVQRGVYEFDGETLRVALTRPPAERPKRFDPAADVLVFTYERAGK